MKVQTLGRIVAVVLLLLVLWGGWKLTHLWEYEKVGPYSVRHNALTGKLQLQNDSGVWTDALQHDAYAPALPASDLKPLRLTQGFWGSKGVLCGRAINTSHTQSAKGRLAIQINVYAFDGKRVKDRTLRATVDWPAGSSTPFVLNTALPTPEANQRWTVDLMPVQAADGS